MKMFLAVFYTVLQNFDSFSKNISWDLASFFANWKINNYKSPKEKQNFRIPFKHIYYYSDFLSAHFLRKYTFLVNTIYFTKDKKKVQKIVLMFYTINENKFVYVRKTMTKKNKNSSSGPAVKQVPERF